MTKTEKALLERINILEQAVETIIWSRNMLGGTTRTLDMYEFDAEREKLIAKKESGK